jgi:dTDP-D-glucose 4,6-dehydratase
MTEKKKVYPYNADAVFTAIKNICGSSRFALKRIDEPIKRIIMSTNPSLFSYGENIEIIVQPEGNDKALVYIKSEPKVFFNITSGGAVEQNIQEILRIIDDNLK